MRPTRIRTGGSPTAHGVQEYLPEREREGVGLCLSGGGFRAALFHLGALRRMNELGLLAGLRTIASVSGGSLAAARLAIGLAWPVEGTAEGWDETVAEPVRAFARRNLRTPAMLRRLWPWNWFRTSTGVETLAVALGRDLGPYVLSQLPERPDFLISATDMAYGVAWIFARDRMGDYQAGYADNPPIDWPLARAVAASVCFPPVFNPLPVRLRPQDLVGGRVPVGRERDRVIGGIRLTDGGVYDNLALEAVWRTHAVVLVSDAGALFSAEGDRNLLWRLRRYAAIPENQAGALRKRWLISNLLAGVMEGAYWGISSATTSYGLPVGSGYSKTLAAEVIARVRTDMDAFSRAEIAILENHGYLLADAALRRHVPALLPDPVPPAVVPHPTWMDETRAAAALRDSAKRTLLGRW